MSRNPIERALGVWSTANYRDVMLPGLGAVTCGQFCDAMAAESLSRTGAVKVDAVEIAETIYRAFGFDPAGKTEDARGIPYGQWAKAVSAASAVLALEPAAPDVIAKGLLSDADAKAAKLGKFGHHPDPAIDFEIEVESLQARLIDAKGGISKPGTEPEAPAAVLADIERAMTFRVGGDPSAVRAKQMLRDLEADAKQAVQPAAPEGQQAVTEAMVEVAAKAVVAEWQKMVAETSPHVSPGDHARAFVSPGNYRLIRAALKAAMEVGRHE